MPLKKTGAGRTAANWADRIRYTDDHKDRKAKFWRILACGMGGTGKTHLIGTFPKPLVINTDEGLDTLERAHIPYINIEMGARAHAEVEKLLMDIYSRNPPFDRDDYYPETLALDSGTSLSLLMEKELVRYPRADSGSPDKEVMSLPDYNYHYNRFMDIVLLLKNLSSRMNVIMTVNTKQSENQVTGITEELPNLAGRKLPWEVSIHFNDVYYMHYTPPVKDNPGAYYLHCRPHKQFKQAKSRFSLPSPIEDPSYGILTKHRQEVK